MFTVRRPNAELGRLPTWRVMEALQDIARFPAPAPDLHCFRRAEEVLEGECVKQVLFSFLEC